MAVRDGRAEQWRKSTWTDNNCVEVCIGSGHVKVRDSKDSEGPILTFTHAEWRAFLSGVHGGEFELPAAYTS